MRILVTGISGSGRTEYIKKFKDYCKRKGVKVQILDVGDMMFEAAEKLEMPVSPEKILDLPPTTLKTLRATVFERLLSMSESLENAVVSSHACFRWKKYLTPGFDFYYLERLNPDLYITIIDSVQDIRARLDKTEQWAGKLSLKEILVWREEEVFTTEMLANIRRKPFYTVARRQPSETLYKLVFKPEMKKVYLSFPITYLSSQPEKMAEIRSFRDKLRKYFVVFDPLTIKDMELKKYLSEAEKSGKEDFVMETDAGKAVFKASEVQDVLADLSDQTVIRDYKLIDQSDYVIVYYPTKLVSPGVLSEMHYGYTNNKKVYAVFPFETSPFFEHYTTKIYKSQDEFFESIPD